MRGVNRGRNTPHFGLGAANHFSSPSHPVFWFLKLRSTVDSGVHVFSNEFLEKVKKRIVTMDDLLWETMRCDDMSENKKHIYVPVSKLKNVSNALIMNSLPLAIKTDSERYKYYHPDHIQEWLRFENKCL